MSHQQPDTKSFYNICFLFAAAETCTGYIDIENGFVYFLRIVCINTRQQAAGYLYFLSHFYTEWYFSTLRNDTYFFFHVVVINERECERDWFDIYRDDDKAGRLMSKWPMDVFNGLNGSGKWVRYCVLTDMLVSRFDNHSNGRSGQIMMVNKCFMFGGGSMPREEWTAKKIYRKYASKHV